MRNITVRSVAKYRSFQGGRSAAVTGVRETQLFYGCHGRRGLAHTDAGNTWDNISDGFWQFGWAVAVSEWDNNVIYVGMGENGPRQCSSGDGMWKSVDAGKAWTYRFGKFQTHSIVKYIPKSGYRIRRCTGIFTDHLMTGNIQIC